MTVLRSAIDDQSADFAANQAAMLTKLDELAAEHAKAIAGGGAKYTDRHRGRGKLLVRERIELLLDPDSPFLELSPLAAWGTEFTVGGSVVTGIGVVEGVECVITASDPTVRGGASNPWTLRKTLPGRTRSRCDNRLPLINLVESGGADLPTQKEIFIPGGRIVPRPDPAVGGRHPDDRAGLRQLDGRRRVRAGHVATHVVMINGRSKVFLGGPPLVKMATGEESDDESLGGAEMHARTSGLADYLAVDEQDAIRIGRRIVARLNWRKHGPPPAASPVPPRATTRSELLGIVPPDLQGARSTRARSSPGSSTARTSTSSSRCYGTSLVTGWASAARLPGRHPGQRAGRAVQRGVAEGGPVHPAGQPGRHAAAVPAEHHRLHGRQAVRAGRHHQARRA